MKIISHRGYWLCESEKNSVTAFNRSFEAGFGVETDVRDMAGELVISHDMPTNEGGVITFVEFLEIYTRCKKNLPLALNVKSDGLQKKIKGLLRNYSVQNYYLFDMSVPDLLGYLNSGLKCLSRRSEFEVETSLEGRADGVWFDEFSLEWIDEASLSSVTGEGKTAFIVSPELHGRDPISRWELYRTLPPQILDRCVLCTDFPVKANDFFKGARND